MSTERVTGQRYTEQTRLEVTLSNGHRLTVLSAANDPRYIGWDVRRRFVDAEHRNQRLEAKAFGLTVASIEVFTDMTEVQTVERTYTKTKLTETRCEK